MQVRGSKNYKSEIEQFTFAAWNFAHTVLWPEQQFCKEDKERALTFIHTYFVQAKDKRKAFIGFCERIVITNKFITGQPTRFVPNPSVWFNFNYEHGFAGTKSWFQQIQAKREDIPDYMKHLTVIAENYLEYIIKPSARVFNKCRKKLLELNARTVLQHFYNCIIHFNYSIQ